MDRLDDRISIKIDSRTHERSQAVLDRLGMSMSGYIRLALSQLATQNRVPFPIEAGARDGKEAE